MKCITVLTSDDPLHFAISFWYWDLLLDSTFSLKKNLAVQYPEAHDAFHLFFILPGTHHCWVNEGSVE